jgi:hypothetical protein
MARVLLRAEAGAPPARVDADAPAVRLDLPDPAQLLDLLGGALSPLARVRHAIHARRLAGAESFTELLSLARLVGVERHGYQIETVHRVLRTLRGRALLSDEVGLGKTIEALMALVEYQQRGMARRSICAGNFASDRIASGCAAASPSEWLPSRDGAPLLRGYRGDDRSDEHGSPRRRVRKAHDPPSETRLVGHAAAHS